MYFMNVLLVRYGLSKSHEFSATSDLIQSYGLAEAFNLKVYLVCQRAVSINIIIILMVSSARALHL